MKYRAKLLQFAQTVRASYWFIPAVMVLAAALVANLAHWLDLNTDILPFQLPDALLNTQAEGARSTLSTIATSIVGVTGVMFSMTVVAVSFAAGNYGPRLISNFMRDRGNQISLGILISTFVYALLVLRVVQSPSDAADVAEFVPHYSILLAIVACIVSVFTMIYFVHHVPETINVSNITAALGKKLECAIQDLIEADNHRDEDNGRSSPNIPPDHVLFLRKAGYIQVLRYHRIGELCKKNGLKTDILCHPSDFVTKYTPVMRIWTTEELPKSTISELQECFAVGTSRTENQSPFFIVDQLVEMLARALSPGVNDPFTAVNCLNWMHNALKTAQYYQDGLGKSGSSSFALSPNLTFDALYERSFGASRPYCESDHIVLAQFEYLSNDLKNEG
ncbi:DUF2254 domain-containing protein [Falsihalocynthiibacter sp. SS001]|uniref:DUF2254 domain-containing protein n=1 Tax=Falsihalocynthiibacter sp. SS001 TaxID=3349698 RepID=UPI0036D2EEA4